LVNGHGKGRDDVVSTEGQSWNPDTLSGTRLGSCLLESPLSISNMGAVYLARQDRPSRYVAVKVIHRQLASDPQVWQLFLARFHREADATATLDFANIVPIYEFGETGDLAYLVMPYLPDGSLATRLEKRGPLPLSLTVQYVEQVAAALDYAHARGIIHRDVKPSNMLLHPDGRVLLADFGIALPVQLSEVTSRPNSWSARTHNDTTLTQAGEAMGTPEYMAPEQVRAGVLTPETDQYGLGIATYELLSGQTPFRGGDVPTVLRRQVQSMPPSLLTLCPELPTQVEKVIFQALAKDPTRRPPTAGQFAGALRAAAEARPQTGTRSRSAGWFLQKDSPSDLGSVAAGLGGSSLPRLFREHTMALPESARPAVPIEADYTRGIERSDHSATTMGPTGRRVQEVLPSPAGADGYADTYATGVPLWPEPRSGPDKKVAIAAIVGLSMSIVALIIIAVLVVNSLQGALVSSGNAPRLAGQTLPTTTAVTSTATAGLVIAPTQITLSCHAGRSVTLQLTNNGSQSVSWEAQTNSSDQNDQSNLAIQPASGTLAAGASQSISVSFNSGGSNSRQGTIQFAEASGQQNIVPAQVSFTAASCHGDGGG
jgi:serine/threonine protein kinase